MRKLLPALVLVAGFILGACENSVDPKAEAAKAMNAKAKAATPESGEPGEGSKKGP